MKEREDWVHIIPREMLIPPREIVRLGNRWIIYLPKDYNEVWEEIKRRGLKVRVLIQLVKSD